VHFFTRDDESKVSLCCLLLLYIVDIIFLSNESTFAHIAALTPRECKCLPDMLSSL